MLCLLAFVLSNWQLENLANRVAYRLGNNSRLFTDRTSTLPL
jgi:hypothetical protein